ncbi:DUF262 domain-containing protein [Chryseobacterium sp.]|uniref:DUF262 domain-containing protein n=1 Tax=Chryseobacterium sp. TaxID=1871047 RepID=UPI002FC69053
MVEANQEIKKISELIEIKNLIIPPYQRPYKWKAENVTQLLDDIFEHIVTKGKVYRIGSLIVHDERQNFNIVDGQQRLTTISILLKALGNEKVLLLNQEYRHKISQDNIVFNYRVIQNWLQKITDKDNFKKQLLEKCEFVLFTVYEADEAFQFFDSQNSRGKTLEPYDLLKAFHLREMEFDSESDRETAVNRWEESIDKGKLKPILGNHLFRIRKWTKNELKYDFTKNDIDEFKGISLHQKQQFPYESSLRMLDGFVENAQNDKFLKNSHVAQSYPFSHTMPIINGKRFFEYVDFYVQQKNNLFKKDDGKFYEFYGKYSKNYTHASRTGDWKVRNLYENILLLYRDKFGNEGFEQFYPAFYKAVYKIRCEKKSIRIETILQSSGIKILKEINDSISTEKLKKYLYKDFEITETNLANGVGFIKNAINKNFREND